MSISHENVTDGLLDKILDNAQRRLNVAQIR